MKRSQGMRFVLAGVFFLCILLMFLPYHNISAMGMSVSISGFELITGYRLAGRSLTGGQVFYVVFLLLPLAGIIVALSNKKGKAKGVVGIILSSVMIILLFIQSTAGYVASGLLLSILLYLAAFVLSVVCLVLRRKECEQDYYFSNLSDNNLSNNEEGES